MMQTEQNNIIDLPDEIVQLIRAGTGKRFLNYLIDVIMFYVLIFLFGIFIGIFNPTFFDDLDTTSPGAELLDRLVTLILYAIYMGAVEAMFKGRSLGKLLTGTIAVNEDGSAITPGKAFARGFSRAVPFCAFSAFGNPCNPWQDRWTDTMVIDIKESRTATNPQ